MTLNSFELEQLIYSETERAAALRVALARVTDLANALQTIAAGTASDDRLVDAHLLFDRLCDAVPAELSRLRIVLELSKEPDRKPKTKRKF